MKQRHLVIVWTPGRQGLDDFLEIEEKLARRAPDIRVFIINALDIAEDLRRAAAAAPTLVISPFCLSAFGSYAGYREFRPLRGTVLAGLRLSKMEQLKRLRKAGIRVARTITLAPTTRLSPKEWGELVITKPNQGSQGSGMELIATADVRWVDPLSHPPGHPRRGHDILVQEYIDPGERRLSYRVMCFLGRPIYSTMSWGGRIDIEGVRHGRPVSVAANTGDREISLNFDRAVIDLARRAASVFPTIPALGIDVLPCSVSGRLYVSEVNPGGDVWHLSSSYGLWRQKERGLDYRAQFGAIDIMADALVEATRRLAR